MTTSNFLTLLSFAFPSIVFAQVQVFPTHVTLSEETPSSYVTLKNATEDEQTYSVELTTFRMDKDGSLRTSKGAPNEIADIIKYSPKSVTLSAGEKQIVRIMATTFDNLEDGERYIHIRFLPVSKQTKSSDTKKASSSFSLRAKIAVAVPIVVRKGPGSVSGEIKNFTATFDAKNNLDVGFSLKNKSKYYLYGDLDIIAMTDDGEKELGKVIGLGSYIPERQFKKTFSVSDLQEKIVDKKIKKVKVIYKSNGDSAAPFELVSETEISQARKTAKKQ